MPLPVTFYTQPRFAAFVRPLRQGQPIAYTGKASEPARIAAVHDYLARLENQPVAGTSVFAHTLVFNQQVHLVSGPDAHQYALGVLETLRSKKKKRDCVRTAITGLIKHMSQPRLPNNVARALLSALELVSVDDKVAVGNRLFGNKTPDDIALTPSKASLMVLLKLPEPFDPLSN